jgi:hypothetical protein
MLFQLRKCDFGLIIKNTLSIVIQFLINTFFPPPSFVLYLRLLIAARFVSRHCLLHGLFFCLWLILGSCPVVVT